MSPIEITLLGGGLGTQVQRTFVLPNSFGAHAYWRLRAPAGQSGAMGISEVEMAGVVGGVDLCTGGTALSGVFSGSPADAFDNSGLGGDSLTYGDGAEGTQAWVGYNFPTPVEIAEIRINPAFGDTRAPGAFIVEYSDDGSTWEYATVVTSDLDLTTVSEGGFYSWPTTAPAASVTPLTPDTALLWRFHAVSNGGGGFGQIRKLRFGTSLLDGGKLFNGYACQDFSAGDAFQAIVSNLDAAWLTGANPNAYAYFYVPTSAASMPMNTIRLHGSSNNDMTNYQIAYFEPATETWEVVVSEAFTSTPWSGDSLWFPFIAYELGDPAHKRYAAYTSLLCSFDVSAAAAETGQTLTYVSSASVTSGSKFGAGALSPNAGGHVVVGSATTDFLALTSNAFCMEAWVKFEATATAFWSPVITKSNLDDLLWCWEFDVKSSALSFRYSTNGTNLLSIGVPCCIQLGTWTHVAMIRYVNAVNSLEPLTPGNTGNGLAFFVNGNRAGNLLPFVSTDTVLHNIAADVIVAGISATTSNVRFSGQIDDLELPWGIRATGCCFPHQLRPSRIRNG